MATADLLWIHNQPSPIGSVPLPDIKRHVMKNFLAKPGTRRRTRGQKRLQRDEDGEPSNSRLQVQTTMGVLRSSTEILELAPGTCYQRQMLSVFLESRYPSVVDKEHLRLRATKLYSLLEQDIKQLPLLSHAVNTLSCSHIGGDARDKNLTYQAQMSYVKAMGILRQCIEGKRTKYDPGTILTSMMCLAIANHSLPRLYSDEWRIHYRGAHVYALSQGPGDILRAGKRNTPILAHMRLDSVFLALASRTPLPYDVDKWISYQTHTGWEPMPLAIETSIIHGIRLANLLARAEDYCHIAPSAFQMKSLWTQLTQLEEEIKSWLKDTSTTGLARELRRLADTMICHSDTDAFDVCIEEHRYLQEQSAPTLSYFRFTAHTYKKHPSIEHVLRQSWMFGLITICTLLRLLYHNPWAADKVLLVKYEQAFTQLERTGAKHATRLCQCLHFLSTMDREGDVHYMQMIRKLAQNFFEEEGAMKQALWCKGFGVATQAREDRIRHSRPPSLCRLGELQDDIGNLSNFRLPPVTGSSDANLHGVETGSNGEIGSDRCPIRVRIGDH